MKKSKLDKALNNQFVLNKILKSLFNTENGNVTMKWKYDKEFIQVEYEENDLIEYYMTIKTSHNLNDIFLEIDNDIDNPIEQKTATQSCSFTCRLIEI